MPLLQVFGDSYPAGYAGAGLGVDNMGAILAAHLKSDFENLALGGTGYVNDAGGNTFLIQANQSARSAATTTLFFGSLNDQTLPASTVQANATAAYNQAKGVAPSTRLVVVGPQWPTSARPTDLLGIRNAVRTAANSAGALWIDPLDDKWFDTRPELIGPDGWHPTDAGHRFMSRQIALAMSVLPVNQ